MSKLISKARSGVTLVELLVVILIVTILSVSMLPLLQPFVVESQYAAEAIPVIGNLRTKIGVYQYDKGHVPYALNSVIVPTQGVATWMPYGGSASSDVYSNAYFTVAIGTTSQGNLNECKDSGHIGPILDIDYQDLKGKRSRPTHYQYLVLATNTIAYAVGCFGNGQGLKGGTGYAVCELNFPTANRKAIGTWKRYKPKSDDGNAQIRFTNVKKTENGCYVPPESEIRTNGKTDSGVTGILNNMINEGWEF